MKIRTNTLTGAALVYAVALTEGYKFGTPRKVEYGGMTEYHFPMTKPGWKTLGSAPYRPDLFKDVVIWGNVPDFTMEKAGDDIIDRELIATTPRWHNAGHDSATGYWYWQADVLGPDNIDGSYQQFGPTRRIAAMRCFVASRFGDEVDVPDQIL